MNQKSSLLSQLSRFCLIGADAGHAGAPVAYFVTARHNKPREREAMEALAQSLDVEFCGIWLEAPELDLVERIGKRRGDSSDATAEVVSAQLEHDIGTMSWQRIDTTSKGFMNEFVHRYRRNQHLL